MPFVSDFPFFGKGMEKKRKWGKKIWRKEKRNVTRNFFLEKREKEGNDFLGNQKKRKETETRFSVSFTTLGDTHDFFSILGILLKF